MTGPGMRERLLGDYLDAVASGAPTPGGGSVAGVVAALGGALGEMVVRLSEGKRAAADAMPQLEAARRSLAEAAAAALAHGEADERVYGRYRDAAALPKATDEEKAARARAIEAALVAATETPLALCATCLDLLSALETVALHGTVHALSDVRLGAYLAESAARGALLNVRGNAAMMKDREAAERFLAAAARVEDQTRERAAAVEAAALARG
ncbi:MAG: cyclodeaminase/cyclohydrolase family protein [Chloroflexota bacterium]